MTTVDNIIFELEEIAPPELAEDNDRIGLQIGDRTRQIQKICVAVDTTPHVIDLAISRGADMLVTHHPLIYSPLTSISEDDPVAQRVRKLIKEDMALYVMHTNLDTVPGGINDALAEKLEIKNCVPLTRRKEDHFYKIVVFVPEEHVEKVRNAMAEAGAGVIGQYTHCSFRTEGIGSFVPLPSAQPFIGERGKLEEVKEYRLEMVCAGSWLEDVIDAMVEQHPYDEVAYDVYILANEPIVYGYGRVGVLKQPTTLCQFADVVKSALEIDYVVTTGDPEKPIKRVAVLGGSGSSHWQDALKAKADVFVTGDTKHHDRLDADASGLAMIDAGHFHTERPGVLVLAIRLAQIYRESDVEVEYVE